MEANQTATQRLGQIVAAELERLDLTLPEAARKAGVPIETFHIAEEEHLRPTIDRAEQICRALGLTMMLGVGKVPRTDGARMAGDSTKAVQWDQAIVYRVKGGNGRRYEAEIAPTSSGRPRWHVVVIDPWPTNLEQSHSAVPLYGPEGASLRKFADAEHTIELYERYALQRDRQRKMANGQSDPVQS